MRHSSLHGRIHGDSLRVMGRVPITNTLTITNTSPITNSLPNNHHTTPIHPPAQRTTTPTKPTPHICPKHKYTSNPHTYSQLLCITIAHSTPLSTVKIPLSTYTQSVILYIKGYVCFSCWFCPIAIRSHASSEGSARSNNRIHAI